MENSERERSGQELEAGFPEAAAASEPLLELRPEDEAPAAGGGLPMKPFLELSLIFLAFWLPAYLPLETAQSGAALAYPAYHLALLVTLLPKALFLLYFMSRSPDFASFGLGFPLPRPQELLRAFFCAALAFCLALLPALLRGILGLFGLQSPALANPFLEAASRPEASPLFMLPLAALSSLVIGYGEELFFRVYLIRRLRQSGLPEAWTLLASALIFGSAHGRQGLLGLGMGGLLGLLFAWRWRQGRSFHEIALGHGLYDYAVILLALYA